MELPPSTLAVSAIPYLFVMRCLGARRDRDAAPEVGIIRIVLSLSCFVSLSLSSLLDDCIDIDIIECFVYLFLWKKYL